MTTCQLAALRSCYCPLWVSPSRLAVDHRHETSRLPLAKRIYPAPYGRTNDVVMYVLPVRVGANNVGVLALEEALGQLTPYMVCFLRSNLAGLKRLTYVVRNHAGSLASRALRVLTLRERELCRHELRCAAIGIDERAVFSFLGVLDVVCALGERVYDTLAF